MANPFDNLPGTKDPFADVAVKADPFDDVVDTIEDDPGFIAPPERKLRPIPKLSPDTRSPGQKVVDQVKSAFAKAFQGFNSEVSAGETPEGVVEGSLLGPAGLHSGTSNVLGEAVTVALDASVRSVDGAFNAAAAAVVETGIELGLIDPKDRIKFQNKVRMAFDIADLAAAGFSVARAARAATITRTQGKGRAVIQKTPKLETAPQRVAREKEAIDIVRGAEASPDFPTIRAKAEREFGIEITPDGVVRRPQTRQAQIMRQTFSRQGELAAKIDETLGVNQVSDIIKARLMTPEDIGLQGATTVKRNVRLDTRLPAEDPADLVVRQTIRQAVDTHPDLQVAPPSRNQVRSLPEMILEGEEVIAKSAQLTGISETRALRQYSQLRAQGGVVDSGNLAALNSEFMRLALANEELARKIAGRTASDIEKAQYLSQQRLLAQTATILEDNIAEHGRALRLLRDDALKIQRMIATDDEFRGALTGGRFRLVDSAKAHVRAADKARDNLGRAQVARKFAKRGPLRKGLDILNEIIVNNLVMGPSTQIINAVSNLSFLKLRELEYGLAGVFTPGVGGRVTAARLYGAMHGVNDGIDSFSAAILHEKIIDFATKGDLGMEPALRFAKTGNKAANVAITAVNVAGRINRLPGVTLLAATDGFYKSVAYNAGLHMRAYLHARKVGLVPGDSQFSQFTKNFVDQVKDRAEDLKKRAPDSLDEAEKVMLDAHKRSMHEARVATFTEPMGVLGRGIVRASNSIPGMKFVVPFVSTLINIQKQTFTRTPLAYMHPTIRKQIHQGTAFERNLAIARMTVGTSFMGLAYILAEEGILFGDYDDDPDIARMQRAAGVVPNSLTIGGVNVGLDRLEPFGLWLGLGARMHQLQKYMREGEWEKLAIGTISTIANNLFEKSYASGLKDLMETLSRKDGRTWQNYLVRNAVNAIPVAGSNLVGQVSRATEDNVFAITSLLDEIKSRASIILGNKGLVVRRNVFGEPIERVPGAAIAPATIRQDRTQGNTLEREMLRLGYTLRMPRRTIEGVELTNEEYWEYVKNARLPATQYMRKVVSGTSWPNMSNAERLEEIKRQYRLSAKTATKLWKFENWRRIDQARREKEAELEKR